MNAISLQPAIPAAAPRAREVPRRRRGVILLVVLGLLTLFGLIGLSFETYASQNGSTPGIERALGEIRTAESTLAALARDPEEPVLRKAAVLSVASALQASEEASAELDADRGPAARRLPGLLRAARSLFRALTRLTGEPDC